MFETLFEILNYYSTTDPLILILENINYASCSTIQWIKWLVCNNSPCSFNIILTLSDYTYFNSKHQGSFDDLIQQLELNGLILQLSENIISDEVINSDDTFISENNSITADDFYNFFALEEALIYYYREYYSLKDSLSNLTLNSFCQILIKLGDTLILLDEYDKASKYYDLLLSYSLEYGDDYLKLISIEKSSMVNILRHKYHNAENLAKQSYSLANKINDSHLLLNAYSLMFWINEKAKYRTNLNNNMFDKEFIEIAKKNNYKNILAYYLTHTFNAIGYAGISDQNLSYYNEGLKIAQELDNQNCILSSYLKTALVYAVKGYYNTSIKYYEKVEKLLITMNDKFRLAQTYNGVGYYLLTKEKYEEANLYYDKALENLRYEWNYDEICMTLLNKSIVYMLACNYKLADQSLNIFLSVLNVLKLNRLRLTTLSRVYGIIGLNNFYLGNNYKTYSFMSKMKANSPNASQISSNDDDDDEFFLVNLLQALLLKSEGKLESSKKYFEEANYYLNKLEGSLKCLYPKFILEYVSLLEDLYEFDDAYKLRNNGINFCIDNSYVFHLNELLGNNSKTAFTFNEDISNLAWIKEAAKQQASLNELNAKVDEINFLNTFQENLSSLDDFNKVISNSMTLLENRFVLDYSLMLTNNDNTYQVIFDSYSEGNDYIKYKAIYNLLENRKSPFLYSTNSSENYNITSSISEILNINIHSLKYIPILKDTEHKGFFICITKASQNSFNNEITLNKENLRILNISIKQLFETLSRIRGQQILLKSAYTDMLTGLCNRQGFYNTLTEILFNNHKQIKNLTLFYIDLDNFKYYNDTFGHKIGDEILIWYGYLLRSVVPPKNTPIRFGGDEFFLLLEDATNYEVKEVAESIYRKLDECNGFIDKISSILGKDINIPKERYLSCSIGIVSTTITNKFNIQDLVDKADKAMYKAKKNGKHKYVITT